MAVRQQYNTALSSADADGICQSQTPLAGGAMTMNGALVASGVATLDTTSAQVNARQILFTFAADESARTFTITGTVLANGAAVTETVTGTATTATSVNYFITVTGISIDAASAGAITVGTNGVGASQWRVIDRHFTPESGILCDITAGTATYGIQWTMHDLFDRTVIPLARDHATIVGQTGTSDGNFGKPVMGYRTKISTGTGTVRTALAPSTARV